MENKETMRQITKFLVLTLTLTLFSCEKKKGEVLQSQNDSGRIVLTLKSSRYFVADPWLIELEATIDGKPNGFFSSGEVVADAVTTENVTFSWSTDNICTVTVIQSNGSKVVIPAYISY